MRLIGKDNGQHVVDIDGEVRHLNDAELDELRATLGLPPLSEPVDAPADVAAQIEPITLGGQADLLTARIDNVDPTDDDKAALEALRDKLVERFPLPATEPPAEKTVDQKAEADKPAKPEKGGK